MNVLVVGANGGTGRLIVPRLIEPGLTGQSHRARGMVRKKMDAPPLNDLGAEPVVADLEYDFDYALEGCDAVICAAGASIDGDPEKIDHQGTVRLIDACKAQGIDRFVLISSMGTTYPDQMPDVLHDHLVAKRKAEEHLEASGLTYTIVRPGGLTDDDGTGEVKAAPSLSEGGSIPRADVATASVLALTTEATYGQAFDIVSGETPIEQALQGLS
ncbi:MAG: SDR family oxidoreductase [Trueperaceae bacterium]|nr:SDR family oxidoreductase [Trueperaceae bacterium]